VEDARLLADSLRTNTSLEYLDISSNGFGPEVLIQIAKAIAENEGSRLSNIHLTQQSSNLGFQCEQAWAELVGQKPSILFLDFQFTVSHWREVYTKNLNANQGRHRLARKLQYCQRMKTKQKEVDELRELASLEIVLEEPPEKPYGMFFQEEVSGQQAFRHCLLEGQPDAPLPTPKQVLEFGKRLGTMTWKNAQEIHSNAVKTMLNAALKTRLRASATTKDKRRHDAEGTLTRLDNEDQANKILQIEQADSSLSIVEFPKNTTIKVSEEWRQWFRSDD